MLRISQSPELCQVPLAAPHGIGVEHAELGFPVFHRNLPNGAVVLGISTIHVAHHTSAEQSMIETRIELFEVVFVFALYDNPS